MPIEVEGRRLSATLRSGEKVRIPAWTLDSGKPGPAFLLVAAQHGNEVQGCEVIRRFVQLAAEKMLGGKVFAVPFANLPAIRQRRPHINMKPEQPYGEDRGHNMNRTWPGNPKGNDTARVSHAIYRAFGEEATHVFDFHCWEKNTAPMVLVRDWPAVRAVAKKLGHRFVSVRPGSDGPLAGRFCATGRIGITYEFSGQYLVEEKQVLHGLRLAGNYAKAIGILPGNPSPPHRPVLFSDDWDIVEVKAPRSGLFSPVGLQLCDKVREGDLLGHLLSDVDLKHQEILAPATGFLRTYGAKRPNCDVSLAAQHPYASRGELLASVIRAKGGK